MTIQELEDELIRLAKQVSDIELSKEQRDEALIEVGHCASAIDNKAFGTPNERSIRDRTDAMVRNAEKAARITDEYNEMSQKLPSLVRKVLNKAKI